MPKLFVEIFDTPRKTVFRKLAFFSSLGVLAGGTAIALQLKHRYSYDFDLFTFKPIPKDLILKVQKIFSKKIKKIVDSCEELSIITPEAVKVSFVHFPFPPLHQPFRYQGVRVFKLRDLASNKAYVIGRRGEYRDYVDLFFLLKKGLKLETIIQGTKKKFGGAFSERLFLEQLVYFKDLKDFQIDFIEEKYSPEQVLNFLQSKVKILSSRLIG